MMKKLLLISLISFLVLSCGATKTDSAAKPSKKTLKGTWQVTNLRFVGEEGLYKATMFDLEDSPCFKGSEWVFIPNNGSGKFSLTGEGGSQCEPVTSRIHWSFYEPGDGSYQFQFKYVDEKNKPLDAANRGYRCNIDSLEANAMEMRVQVTYDGKPFDVVMSFEKISEDFAL
ncbi:MAG: hypothetical protein WBV45_04050 [Lutimonas sp.]